MSFLYLPEEQLNFVYEESLQISKKRISALYDVLNIHAIHRPSIGYWPSNHVVYGDSIKSNFLPAINNAIVVPFYDSNLKLTHVRLIYDQGRNYKIQSIGVGPTGFFNMMNASRHFSIHDAKDPSKRLTLIGSLLKALTKDNAVSSDIITQKNMENLKKIAARLSIAGDPKFLEKFRNIYGFDIQIGGSEMSLTEFSFKNFCFADLAGLDMRYVIPKAIAFVKELPFYERVLFNTEFIKMFKLDLRNVNPLLFEHQLSEQRLFNALKNALVTDFSIELQDFKDDGLEICIHKKDSKAGPRKMILSEKGISEFLSVYYGDLFEFCQNEKIGGMPAQYVWNIKENVRLPRPEIYKSIQSIFYMIVLDIIKKGD